MNTVNISYEDASNCWEIFQKNIQEYMILRNVQKPRNVSIPNSSFASFPLIKLNFVSAEIECSIQRNVLNLHEKSYLHMFLSLCGDIDSYRQYIRPRLKSWLDSMNSRRAQQFIILLIESENSEKISKAFISDKIKFDFADRANLKIVSLKLQSDNNLLGISRLLEVISECVFISVSMNMDVFDDDIKKLNSQRSLPGWNFCNFFLTKELKALSLIKVGLLAESLVCYDELEALFVETTEMHLYLLENNESSINFKSVLPEDPLILGKNLFLIEAMSYRQMIYENSISIFDFGIYLFSKQASLLLEMEHYCEFLVRAKKFICNFVALKLMSSKIRKTWIFDAVVSTLRQISPAFDQIKFKNNLLIDLLLLADLMLNIDPISIPTEEDWTLSTVDIFNLSELKYFDELKLNHQIIQFKLSALKFSVSLSSQTSHERCILLLRLSDALLTLKSYNLALESLHESLSLIESLYWSKLRVQILIKICDCYWNMNMNREFLVKFFDNIHEFDQTRTYPSNFFEKFNQSIKSLDDVLQIQFSNFFKIESISEPEIIRDELFITIKFNQIAIVPLLTAYDTGKITIHFTGEYEDLLFMSESISISEKISKSFKLSHKGPFMTGQYNFHGLSLKFGDIEFVENKISSGGVPYVLQVEKVHDFEAAIIVPDICNQTNNVKISSQSFLFHYNLGDIASPYVYFRLQSNIGIVSNVSVIVSCPDLVLTPDAEYNSNKCKVLDDRLEIQDMYDKNLSVDLKFQISKFSQSVSHPIRLQISYNRSRFDTHWLTLDLPQIWKFSTTDIIIKNNSVNNYNYTYSFLNIQPDVASGAMDEFLKIDKIMRDNNNWEAFNFEIENKIKSSGFFVHRLCDVDKDINGSATTPSITISCTNDKKPFQTHVRYHSNQTQSSAYCGVCQLIYHTLQNCNGEPIMIEVRLINIQLSLDTTFSIEYDPDSWMIDSPKTGIAKERWVFNIIPLKSGTILLPSVKIYNGIDLINLLIIGSQIFIRSRSEGKLSCVNF